jgi:hypothetical protein
LAAGAEEAEGSGLRRKRSRIALHDIIRGVVDTISARRQDFDGLTGDQLADHDRGFGYRVVAGDSFKLGQNTYRYHSMRKSEISPFEGLTA